MRAVLRAAALVLSAAALASTAWAVPLLPDRMLPDTILTYDEDMNPVILQGGYLPEECYQPAFPEPTEIPPYATPEEVAIYRASDQAAAIRYFDQMAGYAPEDLIGGMHYQMDDDGYIQSIVYSPSSTVYPGVRVEYWHDGNIQNIYYPDPVCYPDGGYSIHIHELPPEAAAFNQLRTPSHALPFVQDMRRLVLWFHAMQQ